MNDQDEKIIAAQVDTPEGPVTVGFHSNQETTCLHCGVQITPENRSYWEHFTGRVPGETQAICKSCEEKIYGSNAPLKIDGFGDDDPQQPSAPDAPAVHESSNKEAS